MCGPKFRSMKITQDARDYAASLGNNEKTALGLNGANGLSPHPEEGARAPVSKDEAKRGMKEMSDKFNAMGQQVYVDAEKVKESN
jgi:phosphomethylpyrimidine synthase